MRYQILGPLAVSGTGDHPAITAGRDRVVLAMLLLHPDRALGVGELVDAVWGEDPPATARNQLQTCVSRLRRALPPGAIHTDPAGYRLVVGPGELDAAEFERLAALARARHDSGLYRQALRLWRGPALVGIGAHAVRRAAAVLDERRAVTMEDWADLAIATGAGRELIGELSALVEEFPLRERLRGQLMTALHGAGRQADALAEFRRAREALRDELGIEPGPPLQELHRQILVGGLPESPRPVAAVVSPVRCLPRTVGDFTGRAEVVRRLVDSIAAADPGGPAIAVIDGMAGSGKTTLALHVAALLGDRFPDAHLFVDLHGHSQRAPLEPSAALLVLLRQLGIGAEAVPADAIDRTAMLRTELARRRTLLILDNASSSAQLTDLLPTAPGSLALITSRRRLSGLDGVRHESLALFPAEEAAALLTRIVGDRVAAEPEAAAEVVRRCGGLPLALRLAGARLAHRPRWRVADLARRLDESALPELAAEDRSVAAAFAVSYGQLSAPAQWVFRLLGLYPGADFDGPAVAALTGLALDDAREALDHLVDVHLVDEPEPEVYRLHDLLREFAAALAGEVGDEERRTALHGVLDLQMHAAMATVPPAYRAVLDRDLRHPVPLRPDLVGAVADPEARMERERRNLGAYVAAAIAADLPGYVWQLPRAAWRYLWVRGYLDDVASLLGPALTVAEQIGDRSAVATIANYLASFHYRRAAIDEACRLLERTIGIREELGEWGGVVTAMSNLAGMHHIAGRWAKGIDLVQSSMRIAVAERTPWDIDAWLNVLALGNLRLGRLPEALRLQRRRLLALLDTGDTTRTADSLVEIAVLKFRTGAVSAAAARRQVQAALRICQRARYRFAEGDVHTELARLLFAEGRLTEAVAAHRRAIEIAMEQHDPFQESKSRHAFGTTLRLAGDLPAARDMFRRALEIGQQVRLPYLIANARTGLGDCAAAGGDAAEAVRLWRQAREVYAGLGAPERADIDKRLAEMGGADQLRHVGDGGTMVG